MIPLLPGASRFPLSCQKREMPAKGASAAANAPASIVSIAGIKAAPWQRAAKSSIPDVSPLLSVGLLINGRWWLIGVPREPANPPPQTAAGSIAIGYQPLFWQQQQQQPAGRSSTPSSGCIISASPSAGRVGGGDTRLPAGASPGPTGAFSTCTCGCCTRADGCSRLMMRVNNTLACLGWRIIPTIKKKRAFKNRKTRLHLMQQSENLISMFPFMMRLYH